jgi:hypothetical protein
MPGVDVQFLMSGYAAMVVSNADLPASMDDLFPHYQGAHGTKSVSRKVRQRIVDALVRAGAASLRRQDGVEYYERVGNGDVAHSMALTASQAEYAADLMGITSTKLNTMVASTKLSMRRGVFGVALGALIRIGDSPMALPRSALFKAKRGVKMDERAAWSTPWQVPFLERAAKTGAIRAITGVTGTLYEVGDREILKHLIEGTGDGTVCLHQVLWPGDGCILNHDHACSFAKAFDGKTLRAGGSFQESFEKLPVYPPASFSAIVESVIESSGMKEALSSSPGLGAAPVLALLGGPGPSAGELPGAGAEADPVAAGPSATGLEEVLPLLQAVMKSSLAQTRHDAFSWDFMKSLLGDMKTLTDSVRAIEEARKAESSTMSVVLSRISDLENGVKTQVSHLRSGDDAIRRGLAELTSSVVSQSVRRDAAPGASSPASQRIDEALREVSSARALVDGILGMRKS